MRYKCKLFKGDFGDFLVLHRGWVQGSTSFQPGTLQSSCTPALPDADVLLRQRPRAQKAPSSSLFEISRPGHGRPKAARPLSPLTPNPASECSRHLSGLEYKLMPEAHITFSGGFGCRAEPVGCVGHRSCRRSSSASFLGELRG